MEQLEASRFVASRTQRIVAAAMIAIGIIAVCVSLPLIGNWYGNTDSGGLLLIAIASAMIGMGVSLQSHPLSTAIGVGILCLPLGPLFAFMAYWGLFILMVLFHGAIGL